MDPTPDVSAVDRSGGLLAAGRRLVSAVWEQATIRLELLAIEFAEERARLIGAMVAAGLVVVFAGIAATFAGIGLLVAAWDTPNRVWVAAGLPLAFAIAGVIAWISLRHLIAQQSPLFRHSLAELRRDVEGLRQP
jgi:uncharacterized membrane protein YqjE